MNLNIYGPLETTVDFYSQIIMYLKKNHYYMHACVYDVVAWKVGQNSQANYRGHLEK